MEHKGVRQDKDFQLEGIIKKRFLLQLGHAAIRIKQENVQEGVPGCGFCQINKGVRIRG